MLNSFSRRPVRHDLLVQYPRGDKVILTGRRLSSGGNRGWLSFHRAKHIEPLASSANGSEYECPGPRALEDPRGATKGIPRRPCFCSGVIIVPIRWDTRIKKAVGLRPGGLPVSHRLRVSGRVQTVLG